MSVEERGRIVGGVPWRGLVTPNLDETVRFYGDVLGMRVGEVSSATGYQGRHCFIHPGEVETWGLHFSELPDARVFDLPEQFERGTKVPGSLQHIAFALPDEDAAKSLRQSLSATGVEATPATNLGGISNMLFRDNNGLLLGATCPHNA